MKKILTLLSLPLICLSLASCERAADVASRNLSYAADNFEVERRIVFYNGITDSYMLVVEGRCSLGNDRSTKEITITCKDGEDSYKKHFLGLSDNVTYFVEQVDAKKVSTYNYRVIFRPETIIPALELDLKKGAK